VQVIVDAQWNKIPRPVQAHLLAEGIEIREYHPFGLSRLRWVTRRMHDKMVVTDGRELLAGGRNVESTYFGFGRQIRRRNYIDLDLQVEGNAAAEARDYFRALWASREVRAVRARATPAEIAEASRLLDRHKAWLDARVEQASSDPNRPPAELTEVGPVRFLHDPVGRKGRAPGVGQSLRELLDSARESVLIESPYLVPSRAFRKSLRQALARGVRVRILTNSLAATDELGLAWRTPARTTSWEDVVELHLVGIEGPCAGDDGPEGGRWVGEGGPPAVEDRRDLEAAVGDQVAAAAVELDEVIDFKAGVAGELERDRSGREIDRHLEGLLVLLPFDALER
jgi:hypothetical protein